MNIDYAPSFNKRVTKLSRNLRERIASREDLFRNYPFHMSLKIHKLHGKMKDKWAFSINNRYRIMFEFVSEDTVRFLDIGTHDIYD